MTLEAQLEYIRDTLETGLPPLFVTANIPNFSKYSAHDTEDSNTLELGMYPDVDRDVTDSEGLAVIIKVQMYGQDLGVKYFDVMKPFIKKNIKASELGYTNRDSLITNFWPVDQNSTSYVYFSIVFSSELDDCSD